MIPNAKLSSPSAIKDVYDEAHRNEKAPDFFVACVDYRGHAAAIHVWQENYVDAFDLANRIVKALNEAPQ